MTNNFYFKDVVLVICVFLVAVGIYIFGGVRESKAPVFETSLPILDENLVPTSSPVSESEEVVVESVVEKQTEIDPKELSESFLIQVPFTPQAPKGIWDKIHNEACEEVSVIMAAAYLRNDDTRSQLPIAEVEAEIFKLVDWQTENFGYHLDSDAEETARMAREFYGLNAEVVPALSEEELKRTLLEDKLVIVPVDGKKIGNPHFRPPGPPYHMFVVRGYSETKFITNDPGTRYGKAYEYDYQTIIDSNGDWSHETGAVDLGRKVMIVLSK